MAALVYLRRRDELPLGGRLFICEIGIVVAVICSAANYWWFAPQIKAVQQQLTDRYGAFHQADKLDPLFGQFSGLHQTSPILFIVGFASALLCLICMTQFAHVSRPRLR